VRAQCGKKSSFFVIKAGNAQLDFVAFGITLARRPPAGPPPACQGLCRFA
jgi:hypothetical protein